MFEENGRDGPLQQVIAVEIWHGHIVNSWMITTDRYSNLERAFGEAVRTRGLDAVLGFPSDLNGVLNQGRPGLGPVPRPRSEPADR